jgi:RHS repeat-associated protein
MLSGDGRTVTFDNLDRAITVTANGYTTQFRYAPDGQRYVQSAYSSGATTNEYYDDKLYETVESASSPVERTYVSGSVMIVRTGAKRAVRYRHLDRLGSLDAVTMEDGSEDASDAHGLDAFGKPRPRDFQSTADETSWQMQPGDGVYTTERGFTGHEHLDDLYLIHMNGRVYDYRLGRFLSVDPIISNPLNSQSLNPYSYIGNNPFSGIDPTGYWPLPPPALIIFPQSTNGRRGSYGPATSEASETGTPKDVAAPTLNQVLTAISTVDFWRGFGFGALQAGIPLGSIFSKSPEPNNPDYEAGRATSLTISSGAQLLAGRSEEGAGSALLGAGIPNAETPEGQGAIVVGISAVTVGEATHALGAINAGAAAKAWINVMAARGPGDGGAKGSKRASQDPPSPDSSTASSGRKPRGTPLTNAEARAAAKTLGFKEVSDAPFDSHGQLVFQRGSRYISADADVHSGGKAWKMFDRAGNRLGTFTEDLKVKLGQ